MCASRILVLFVAVGVLVSQLLGQTANKEAPCSGCESKQSEPTNATKETGSDSSERRTGFQVTESIFDAARNHFSPVETRVEVRAEEHDLDTSAPSPYIIGGQEIITAAGSYGDIMRYLQVLPGVVPTSDINDEVLVRGGHPLENLYRVEGFDVPNINHLAKLGSSGGFGPMIDSALVQSMTIYTGGYSAEFPDHLSSVTEINLLNSKKNFRHMEGDFGIQGIGGLLQEKAHSGDLLVSGHHGLLDAVTHDAGMNGVPSYTNELTRFRLPWSSGDSITVLNVAGWDSIEITPCQADQAESSSINTQYSGWRETTGARWQHVLSPRSFGVFRISDSEQVQHIHQQDQHFDPLKATPVFHIACPLPKDLVHPNPVYVEDSNSASSSAAYEYQWGTPALTISGGTSAWLQRPHFNVAQPGGVFSPYSSASTRSDSRSFSSDLSTGETGSFLDVSYRGVKNLSLGWGSRLQTIAFGNHVTLTSRVNARYRLGEYLALNAAFATYAQMPPYIYLLSFDQNRALLPMRVQHRILGLDFDGIPGSRIHIEAYQKPYFETPAASEYPTVTLHNLPDQLGDQIMWIPMSSKGRGQSSGIEVSDITRIKSRILIKGSLAYARAKFAGEDRVLRPSDFDFPWILNLLSNAQVGKGFSISARYGYATGRPYTPFDIAASRAQNRPIYDLDHVNSLRAPYYARLDAQLNKDILIRGQHLEIYAGVDNVINRRNFLTFAWMPIAFLGKPNRYPVTTLYQMPVFPNFGVRFIVK